MTYTTANRQRHVLRAAPGGRRAALAGLVACGAACGGEPAPAARNGPRGADRVEPVQVEVATLASASRSVAATGTVEPVQTVGVVSQLGGVLEAVRVEEGDRVREGAVLARIAVPEVEAQLRSAAAALAVARRAAERSARLFGSGVLTVAENERDQTALAAAQATHDQLRTRLGYATVRSPLSGVVLERTVRTGDLASPQMRLFTLGDVGTLIVRVPVSERDVTALRTADRVDVTLDALPGRAFSGEIRRIFPAADSATRLVPVEVALTDATAAVRPGFLARVAFRLAPRTGILLVAGNAVLENPRGAVVYVVQSGRATLRSVERGATHEGRVEIRSGLAPGDSVVIAGNTMLRDGVAVRVMPRGGADAPPSDTAAPAVGVR